MKKAGFLQEFYEKTIKQLRLVRSRKQDEWQQVIEESRVKIENVKQQFISMIEQYFNGMENTIINQYLIPWKETAYKRVQMPIKVQIIRKCRKRSPKSANQLENLKTKLRIRPWLDTFFPKSQN
jgi:hypothetical protein